MKKIIPMVVIAFLLSGLQIHAQKGNNEVKITELSTATFKQKVWDFDKNKGFKRVGNLPIILDFYATWCPPCKMLTPNMHEIQKKYAGKLIIYKIDVDKEPQLARRFKIEAMPTLIFIDSSASFTSEVGYLELAELDKIVKEKFKL